MTMGVEKRSDFWDVLRGFAMLIVVFGHSLQVCNGGDPNNPLHLVIRYFQMELLFFISGYVSEWSHSSSLGGAVWSKFLRLGVPYLAWVGLFYLLHVTRGGGGVRSRDIFRCVGMLRILVLKDFVNHLGSSLLLV